MAIQTNQDKPFACERFISPDSQSLGPAPWNTRLQTPKRSTFKDGVRGPSRKISRRWKCPPPIDVSKSLSDCAFTYSTQMPTKRGFQFMFLSLGFIFLAWKAVLPCYIAIAACYISQVFCEIDRTFLSASMNPFCKLALLSHTPDNLLSQTCPTAVLWTIKPYVSHTLMGFPTPISFNRNYAAYGGGASILRRYTSKTHNLPSPSVLGSLGEAIFGHNPQYANVNGAGIILEENMGVGECWQMSGGVGHVAVNLSEPVFISHIVMDYASPSVLSKDDIASAPKNMALWALPPTDNAKHELRMPIRFLNDFKSIKDGKDDLPGSSRALKMIDFQYDILEQPTRQLFPVPIHRHFPTQTIILEIETNGGSDTTCVYWLGVYGQRSVSVS